MDITRWDAHFSNANGRRYWPNEELVRFAGKRRFKLGGCVVDVGCGDGANLPLLAQSALQVYGVDSSDVALQRAASQIHSFETGYRVKLIKGSAEQLDEHIADHAVDGVVDCMVSQHLPWETHGQVYAQYRHVLKLGGWLFTYHMDAHTSPRYGGYDSKVDWREVPSFPAVDLFCLPTLSMLKVALIEAHFKVEESWRVQRLTVDGTVSYSAIVARAV